MRSRLILVHARSPLHAGTGRALGAIDLPIARERPTGIPLLPGSSIKGALRARCKEDRLKWDIFGPETAKSSDYGGSVQFSDAHLVLLPVRSLAGTFAWVTSPYLLQRFTRTAREAGLAPPDLPAFQPDKAACGVIGDTLKAGSKVVLEDLDFTPAENLDSGSTRDSFVSWLAGLFFPNEDESGVWRKYFRQRFCLVHDDIMSYLLETAVEVTARIRLDDNTKTVADGGLWYEESLPCESFLAGIAVAADVKAFNGRSDRTGDELLDHVSSLTQGLVQLGGKATTGHGTCAVHVVGG